MPPRGSVAICCAATTGAALLGLVRVVSANTVGLFAIDDRVRPAGELVGLALAAAARGAATTGGATARGAAGAAARALGDAARAVVKAVVCDGVDVTKDASMTGGGPAGVLAKPPASSVEASKSMAAVISIPSPVRRDERI